AEELPDLPVRRAAVRGRASGRPGGWGGSPDRDHEGPPGGRHGQDRPRRRHRPHRRRRLCAGGLQPGGRPTGRGRVRAGHAPAGRPLAQETRHWDENRNITTPGRSKEYASDYRYFPEPDLTPIEPDPAWIEKLRTELPELPSARRRRFQEAYRLESHQAALIG